MPALLPPANVDVKVEESCSICGWGNMAYPDFRPAEKLQCVDLPVIGTNTCNKGYRGAIHEDIMCIGLMKGGQDSCQVNDQSKFVKIVNFVKLRERWKNVSRGTFIGLSLIRLSVSLQPTMNFFYHLGRLWRSSNL